MQVLVALALAACKSNNPASKPADDDSTTPFDTDTTETTDTATGTAQTTGDSGPVTDTSVGPPADCKALKDRPLSIRELGRPRGHHGLAFDLDGNVIGLDNGNLIKVAFDDTFFPWAVGINTTEQMDWLLDGDLAVADAQNNAIVRIDAAGIKSPIVTDTYTYGLTVGPNGMIYAANNDVLYEIDPATGQKPLFVPDGPGFSPRVTAFSPDLTKMYVGNFGGGEIYIIDLDANLDPIGNPYLFVSGAGAGPYMDCMAVDECGILYTCDFSDRVLYRITPGGFISAYIDWNPISMYGHGVAWGRGVGGWLETGIYLPQPYDGDTVVEVEIGVRAGKALWP